MRLVCPNCEAKYEVPEDAIPETGRDVQCANCGHAWYQMRSRAAAEPAAAPAPAPVAAPAPLAEAAPVPTPEVTVAATETVIEPADPVAEVPPEEPALAEAAGPDLVAEPASEPETLAETELPSDDAVEVLTAGEPAEPESAADAPAAPEAVAEAAPSIEEPVETAAGVEDVAVPASVGAIPAIEAAVVEAVVAEEAAEEAADDADQPAVAELADTAAPTAYAVDDSVLAILREEAEREAQARLAEAARPVETQVDLGIDSAVPARPAEISPVVPAVAAATVAGADPMRRTRLPDVEEINSTLRPTETAADDGTGPETAPVEGRSSFRSGFLLVMTVAILGSALYGSADALASAIPALAGPLAAYVSFVDSLRLHLDGLMQSATVAINGT